MRRAAEADADVRSGFPSGYCLVTGEVIVEDIDRTSKGVYLVKVGADVRSAKQFDRGLDLLTARDVITCVARVSQGIGPKMNSNLAGVMVHRM